MARNLLVILGQKLIPNEFHINVSVHMKDLKALSTFKNQIKKWIPKDCPCSLCKAYVAQVDFL